MAYKKQCINCMKPAEPDWRVCIYCGTRLPADAVWVEDNCSASGKAAPSAAAVRKCLVCANELRDSMLSVCPRCGCSLRTGIAASGRKPDRAAQAAMIDGLFYRLTEDDLKKRR